MACYIRPCTKDPMYSCKQCGGLVCEDHGWRVGTQKECLCDNCIAVATNSLSATLAVYVASLPRSKVVLSRHPALREVIPGVQTALQQLSNALVEK